MTPELVVTGFVVAAYAVGRIQQFVRDARSAISGK
jgi:hypothetical protein